MRLNSTEVALGGESNCPDRKAEKSMKGFNVFLAIVIFLLAVASAVFSYFLYEKRASLVTGHSYFAKHLTEATQKLESNSGSRLSDKVTEDSLRHSNAPKSVNDQLTEFNKLVSAVVDERDVLASTLAQVSNSIELNSDKSKFTKLSSYKTATAQLSKYAKEYRQRNDAILTSVVQSGKKLGASKISAPGLKSSSYANVYRELDDRIAFWTKRHSTYVSSVAQIASALKAGKVDNSEAKYAAGLSALVTHARNVERQRLDFQAKWKSEERKVSDRDKTIKKLKDTISAKDATINNKNLEIKRLEKMLGIDPGRRAIKDGSAEALQLIKTQKKGKIMEVNTKFGFVVVSLGKKTQVQDFYNYKPTNESPLEVRKWDVDPMIEEGMILTVARNMPSGDAEYINKVKVVKVEDHCVIAEAIDKEAGKPMLEDDFVYVADDEIAKWSKNRK